ncbi:MaoC family dehydratase [Streptomyces sp. NPDC059569]|uniref:MaoC family dehydratase n=1 Tax=Streptomyces sp. NPDC059569 TaxID=3346869 RepID=UPI0036C9B870
MTYGRFFDDFEAGALYQHWPGKTVTEYDHHQFCLLTLVRHPVHTDHQFARTATAHGRPLVVGSYVFALLIGLSEADVAGAAMAHRGFDKVEHVAPLFHGDTLYAESRVLDKHLVDDRPGRGAVELETRGMNQHGTLICRFTRLLEVPRGRHPLAESGHHPHWPFAGDTVRQLLDQETGHGEP